MKELIRTNDAVLISFVEALLRDAGIAYLVADQNMSVLDGSLGILPRRIMVDADEIADGRARSLPTPGSATRSRTAEPGRAWRCRRAGPDGRRLPPRPFLAGAAKDAGHRAGMDAMMLAAAVPSGFAGRLADFGAGAGAAGLAVASRCPAAEVVLVENAPEMLRLSPNATHRACRTTPISRPRLARSPPTSR